MITLTDTLFPLLGGLAMFLFGMNSMSSSLQKAAGSRLKQLLARLTGSPWKAVLAGAFVTAVLQSSSAVTVMIIGFVSAGLMSLPAAIAVMFGCNIGTTMTAQLLAFSFSDYIYPILFAGFAIMLASRRKKIKEIGMVLFSFGLLFEGIQIMSAAMKPIVQSAVFVEMMEQVAGIPVLGVLLGAGMTLMVQSSSATIAILQNAASAPTLAGTSALGLAGALPILLGDNIGTTITAILAASSQSKDARRVALAHLLFNVTGTLAALCLMPWFIQAVTAISPTGAETEIISRQIANAHTLFNICSTILWFPMISLLAKMVCTLIPDHGSLRASLMSREGEDAHMVLANVQDEVLDLSGSVRSLFLSLQNMISSPAGGFGSSQLSRIQEGIQQRSADIMAYLGRAKGMHDFCFSQQQAALILLQETSLLQSISLQQEKMMSLLAESGKKTSLDKSLAQALRCCLRKMMGLYDLQMQMLSETSQGTFERIELQKKAVEHSLYQLNMMQVQMLDQKNGKDLLYELSMDLQALYGLLLRMPMIQEDKSADSLFGAAADASAFLNSDLISESALLV